MYHFLLETKQADRRTWSPHRAFISLTFGFLRCSYVALSRQSQRRLVRRQSAVVLFFDLLPGSVPYDGLVGRGRAGGSLGAGIRLQEHVRALKHVKIGYLALTELFLIRFIRQSFCYFLD